MITFIICSNNVKNETKNCINLSSLNSITDDIKTPYFMFVDNYTKVLRSYEELIKDFLPDLLILSPSIEGRKVLNKFRRHNQEIIVKEQNLFNKIISTDFYSSNFMSSSITPFEINLNSAIIALKIVIEPVSINLSEMKNIDVCVIPRCISQIKNREDSNLFYSDILRDELNFLKAHTQTDASISSFLAIDELLKTREL